MTEARVENTELVIALKELLQGSANSHLILASDSDGQIRIQPEDGWRRYAFSGIEEDENVLARMEALDASRWPVIRHEAGDFLVSSGGDQTYRGTDATSLVAAISELFEDPAFNSPVMMMQSMELDDGFGFEVVYASEIPPDTVGQA